LGIDALCTSRCGCQRLVSGAFLRKRDCRDKARQLGRHRHDDLPVLDVGADRRGDPLSMRAVALSTAWTYSSKAIRCAP